MPGNFNNKALKFKWTDICARAKGILIVMIWKDKQNMCILANVHKLLADDNFYDECGRAHKNFQC